MWQTWSNIASSDFVTRVAIPGLVSVAASVITGAVARRRQQKEKEKNAVIDEVKRIIILARELSEQIKTEVEAHLTGSTQRTFRDSQRFIGSQIKAIAVHLNTAEVFLQTRDFTALENEYLRWTEEMTAEPYPIQRKADVLQAHDARLGGVRLAQEKWCKYLATFTVKCTTGKIACRTN